MEKVKSYSKKVDRSKAESRPQEHGDGCSTERHSFNPFEGRNKEEVWKEISKNGTSMSQPEQNKKPTSKEKRVLPPNPFAGRDADEVWQELWANSKPISHEEVMRRTSSRRSDQSED